MHSNSGGLESTWLRRKRMSESPTEYAAEVPSLLGVQSSVSEGAGCRWSPMSSSETKFPIKISNNYRRLQSVSESTCWSVGERQEAQHRDAQGFVGLSGTVFLEWFGAGERPGNRWTNETQSAAKVSGRSICLLLFSTLVAFTSAEVIGPVRTMRGGGANFLIFLNLSFYFILSFHLFICVILCLCFVHPMRQFESQR